mmetsp:Transcript_60240/g.140803  ORF Transcript_60240/g.140803 Transcript_60240/m.140803 type:complete len:241 (-) Transcript_60240:614-1336(-)
MHGVDPASEHCMVTVLQAFILVKEGIGSALIESFAVLLFQGSKHCRITSSTCLCDPLLVGRALDAVCWPIRAVDRALRNKQLTILPNGHRGVARVGSHPPGQHRIQSVKPQNAKEVPGADVRLVEDVAARVGARLHACTHVIPEELYVPLRSARLYSLRAIWSEEQGRLQKVAHGGNGVVLEGEDSNAECLDVPDLAVRERCNRILETLGSANGCREHSHPHVRSCEKAEDLVASQALGF